MEALGINLSGLITQLISFTVLFLILRKLLFGPIGTMLQTRSEKIKESLEAAEKVKNEADESAQRLEDEINAARQEGQKLIQDAREAAEKYRLQQAEKAEQDSQELVKKTEKEMAKLEEKTIQNVKKEFSSLVISAATKVVDKSIDEKDHKELIDKTLKEEINN